MEIGVGLLYVTCRHAGNLGLLAKFAKWPLFLCLPGKGKAAGPESSNNKEKALEADVRSGHSETVTLYLAVEEINPRSKCSCIGVAQPIRRL